MSSPPRPQPSPKRLPASNSPSPTRRPLAQRSESGANEQGPTPTIRIVADTGPSSYAKSALPSDPAHYLPPRPSKNLRAFVSDENALQHSTYKSIEAEPLVSTALQPRNVAGSRMSTDTTLSFDSETLANYQPVSFSPSLSSRFSFANTTTPSTPTLDDDRLFQKLPSFPKDQGRASTASQSTIRLVTPERQTQELSLLQKEVNFTVFSSDSTDAVDVPDRRRQSSPPSPNFHIYSSSTNSLSSAHDPTQIEKDTEPEREPTLTAPPNSSSDSVAYSVISVARRRSASSPPPSSHAELHNSSVETVQIQYPVLRQSSASASFAVVTDAPEPEPALQPDARMSDDPHRLSVWSSRLSTIASESEPRSHDDVSAISSEQLARRSPRLRHVYGSISSVGTGISSPSTSSIPIPAPLFTPRDLPMVPQARDSEEASSGADEVGDTLGELPPQQLRPQRSGYMSRLKQLSRPGSSESINSQLSFVGDLSWVR
jgi:hypothetical protein